MSYENLSLTIDGHIARLLLNRPDKANAFDEAMHTEFSAVLAELSEMTDIRVILLHAAGRHFSAGGDFAYIRALRASPEMQARTRGEGIAIFTALTQMHVPIVAAVQGHALGFGATIISTCDAIVAYKDAKIGDPHVVVGLTAGDGGVLGWTAAVGHNRARRLLLTGDSITATEAYQFGLVTDLVDTADAALPAAEALAKRIAALPPIAVQGTRKTFNALTSIRHGDVMPYSIDMEFVALRSEDLMEAVDGAVERRPGVYHNR